MKVALYNATFLTLLTLKNASAGAPRPAVYLKCDDMTGFGIFNEPPSTWNLKAALLNWWTKDNLKTDFDCHLVTNDCIKAIIDLGSPKNVNPLSNIRSRCSGINAETTFDKSALSDADKIAAILGAGVTNSSTGETAMNQFQRTNGNNCEILKDIKNFVENHHLMAAINANCAANITDLFVNLDSNDLIALSPAVWQSAKGKDTNLNDDQLKTAVSTAAADKTETTNLAFLTALAVNLSKLNLEKLTKLKSGDLKALLVKNSTLSQVIGKIRDPFYPGVGKNLTDEFNVIIPTLNASEAAFVNVSELARNNGIAINGLLTNSSLKADTLKSLDKFDVTVLDKITDVEAIKTEVTVVLAANKIVAENIVRAKASQPALVGFLGQLAPLVGNLNDVQLNKLTADTIIVLSNFANNTLDAAVTKGTANDFLGLFARNLHALKETFLASLNWDALDKIKSRNGLKLQEAINTVTDKSCIFVTDVATHLNEFGIEVLEQIKDPEFANLKAIDSNDILVAAEKAPSSTANQGNFHKHVAALLNAYTKEQYDDIDFDDMQYVLASPAFDLTRAVTASSEDEFVTSAAVNLEMFHEKALNSLSLEALKVVVTIPEAEIIEAYSRADSGAAKNFKNILVQCHAEINMENLEALAAAATGKTILDSFTLTNLIARANEAPSGKSNSGKFHEYLAPKCGDLTNDQVNALTWDNIQRLKKLNLGILCAKSTKGAFVKNIVGQKLEQFDPDSLQTLTAAALSDIATECTDKTGIKLEDAFAKTGRAEPFLSELAKSIDKFENLVLNELTEKSILQLSDVAPGINKLADALTKNKDFAPPTFYKNAVAAKSKLNRTFLTSAAAVTAFGDVAKWDKIECDLLNTITDEEMEDKCGYEPNLVVTTLKKAVDANLDCNLFNGLVSKHLQLLSWESLNKLTSTQIEKLVSANSSAAEAANKVQNEGAATEKTFVKEFAGVADKFAIGVLNKLDPNTVKVIFANITETQFTTMVAKTPATGQFHINAAKYLDQLEPAKLKLLTAANLVNIIDKPEFNLKDALTAAGPGVFRTAMAKDMLSFDIKVLESLTSLADLAAIDGNTILAAAEQKTTSPAGTPNAGNFHKLVASLIADDLATYGPRLNASLMLKLPGLKLDKCNESVHVCKVIAENLVAFHSRLSELTEESVEKMAENADVAAAIDLNGAIKKLKDDDGADNTHAFIVLVAKKLDKFHNDVLNNILEEALVLLSNVAGQETVVAAAVGRTTDAGALWQLASKKFKKLGAALQTELKKINDFVATQAVQISVLDNAETISESDVNNLIENYPDEVLTKIRNTVNSPTFFSNVAKSIEHFQAAKLNEFKQSDLLKLNIAGSTVAKAINAYLNEQHFQTKFLAEFAKVMHQFQHDDLNNLNGPSINASLKFDINFTSLMTQAQAVYDAFQDKMIQALNDLDAPGLNALKSKVTIKLPTITGFNLQKALKTVGDAIPQNIASITDPAFNFIKFVAQNLDSFEPTVLDTIQSTEMKLLKKDFHPKFKEAFTKDPTKKPEQFAATFVENLKDLSLDFTKELIDAAFGCAQVGPFNQVKFINLFVKQDPNDATKEFCALKAELFSKKVIEKFDDEAFKTTDEDTVKSLIACLKNAVIISFSPKQLEEMNSKVLAELGYSKTDTSPENLKLAKTKFGSGEDIGATLFNELLKEGKGDVCKVKTDLKELPDLSDEKIVDCYGQLKGSDDETKWDGLLAAKITNINNELFKFLTAKVAKKLGSEVSGIKKEQFEKIPTLSEDEDKDSETYKNHACYYFLVENAENAKKLSKLDEAQVRSICEEKKFAANEALILKSTFALILVSAFFSLLL